MREIRSRANDVEDKEKGIKIAKKDWEKLHVYIDSYNNFPTAAGLASSAAGLACLGKPNLTLNIKFSLVDWFWGLRFCVHSSNLFIIYGVLSNYFSCLKNKNATFH